MSGKEAELRRLTYADKPQRIAAWAMLIYLTIYAFESPIRYVLYLVHASQAIVARDLLIMGPLALMAIYGLMNRKLHPAFLVFGIFIGFSTLVSLLNFGTILPAAMGTKIMLTALFGLVAGTTLIIPGKRVGRYLVAMWLMTVVALVLEKYVVSFPWVGLKDYVGGVEVELSRDWQITDAASKRVGGFTRSSIQAAALSSELGLVVVFLFRSYLVRVAILAITIGAVFLTTQKGALIGLILISAVICGPPSLRLPGLRILVIVALILVIAFPLYTNGLVMEQGHGGVFSGASFAERIDETWPRSLKWIETYQIFPFGIGLGGMGVAQIVLGKNQIYIPDNMFLYLYAFFGIFCFVLCGWIIYAALRSITIDPDIAGPALAVLAFNLLYGIVVTIFEDQAAGLYTGASLGLLLVAARIRHPRPIKECVLNGGEPGSISGYRI